ncbi:MAG: helix-turn-helix domain-containing protein [Hyphomonadaceae bacterium]
MSRPAHTDGAASAAPIQNYRVGDFAACFGISVRTAWDLIARGEIEAIKIGRRTLVVAASAQAWQARCPRVAPTKRGAQPANAMADASPSDHGKS